MDAKKSSNNRNILKKVALLTLSCLIFSQIPFLSKVSSADLDVEISANPTSGTAPLYGVDVTANVYGTVTGDITYKFDCTNDGSWEKIVTTPNTSYTAVDLCNYPNPGNYTIKVKVERGEFSYEGTIGIVVTQPTSLSVTLTANPSHGTAPLNGVDLTANVTGSNGGDITYKFDCTNDGSWEKIVTTPNTSYTAVDLCNYPNPGNYTAKVRVEQGGLAAEATAAIRVESPTLSVTLSANPSSGNAPLNDVDLTANVSGSASGDITYKFDCTSDGSWEKIVTTPNTSYTAYDLCDYPNPGNYTAKVRVERGGLSAEDTTQISVVAPPNLKVKAYTSPSSGYAPLTGVDVSIEVYGTASGDITYKIDCHNDGYWDREITTSNTSYTAYDLCDYGSPGVYQVKIYVSREGVSVSGILNVIVEKYATLAMQLYVSDPVGEAPLEDVDFTVYVSGSATGDITYKFDCTSDGIWEKVVTTSSNSYTAYDVCDYYNPGEYTAKVQVTRGGYQVEGAAKIIVY